jgi:hypothetical protein
MCMIQICWFIRKIFAQINVHVESHGGTCDMQNFKKFLIYFHFGCYIGGCLGPSETPSCDEKTCCMNEKFHGIELWMGLKI